MWYISWGGRHLTKRSTPGSYRAVPSTHIVRATFACRQVLPCTASEQVYHISGFHIDGSSQCIVASWLGENILELQAASLLFYSYLLSLRPNMYHAEQMGSALPICSNSSLWLILLFSVLRPKHSIRTCFFSLNDFKNSRSFSRLS